MHETVNKNNLKYYVGIPVNCIIGTLNNRRNNQTLE